MSVIYGFIELSQTMRVQMITATNSSTVTYTFAYEELHPHHKYSRLMLT